MERYKVAGEISADEKSAVSLELAVAQRKLEQFRQAFRANHIRRQTAQVQVGRFHSPRFPQVHKTRPNLEADRSGSLAACGPVPILPPHLGWHSGPATKAYRQALKNQSIHRGERVWAPVPVKSYPSKNAGGSQTTPLQTVPIESRTPANATITVPPDIALAILRQKLAAPGRIWFLLRHIDSEGRGWITADIARKRLTNKKSPLAVCGKRQLRNLLAAGESIFWERDAERIWLKSLAKVAAVLGLSRLHGRSVQLPLPTLLQSIGNVRAHLYASFHSSRSKPDPTTDKAQNRPISRETLKTLTATTRRTQRLYEKRAGIQQQPNYALGSQHTTEGEQNLAWQLGRAYFRFTDSKGLHGPAGKSYLAWQLPNSYHGPHNIDTKGYQRRINRQLTDLLTIGITGNGRDVSVKAEPVTNEAADGYRKKLFYGDGAQAAKDYNRQPDQDLYWKNRGTGGGAGRGRFQLWHALPAKPVDNCR